LFDAAGAIRTTARPGQVLLRQGESHARLFLLEAGSVELSCVVESGRDCVLDLVLPGEVFGGSAREAPFGAAAREGCRLRGADAAAVGREAALAGFASERALRFAERLRDAMVLDAAERVMALFCDLADRLSTTIPEGRRVDVSITQQDLARMTGCTRETVNRTLSRLSVERRLLRRGRRYVVPYLR
jgi:CRP/FNR family cyclic AMP-dependent transcriptional regulator